VTLSEPSELGLASAYAAADAKLKEAQAESIVDRDRGATDAMGLALDDSGPVGQLPDAKVEDASKSSESWASKPLESWLMTEWSHGPGGAPKDPIVKSTWYGLDTYDLLPQNRAGVKNAARSSDITYEYYLKPAERSGEAAAVKTGFLHIIQDIFGITPAKNGAAGILNAMAMALGAMCFSITLFLVIAVATFGWPKRPDPAAARRRVKGRSTPVKSPLASMIVDVDDVAPGTVCAVCLVEQESATGLPLKEEADKAGWCQIPCKHHFHRQCLDRWLTTASSCQQRCPLCNFSCG